MMPMELKLKNMKHFCYPGLVLDQPSLSSCTTTGTHMELAPASQTQISHEPQVPCFSIMGRYCVVYTKKNFSLK